MREHKSVGCSEKVIRIEKSESFIKKPNSYQNRLFCLFQQGEINKFDYLSELSRYDDFRIKKEIFENYTFESIVSDIEFKELINYLREANYMMLEQLMVKNLMNQIRKPNRLTKEQFNELYEKESEREAQKEAQKPIKLTESNVRSIIEKGFALAYKNREISKRQFRKEMSKVDDYLDDFLEDREMVCFD